MYAFVYNNEVTETTVPKAARKLVDGEPVGDWVLALPKASEELKAECGYFKIRDTKKPPHKKGVEKVVRKLTLLGGEPTWEYNTVRMTTDELITKASEDEVTFSKDALKQLRTFRKKGDAMSLKDVKDNLEIVNRILIKLVTDRYGED